MYPILGEYHDEYAGPCLVPMIKAIAEGKKGLYAIHLDHCHHFDVVMQCVRAGFSSVMFDGSLLSFEENVLITKKVIEVAHAVGISVEAELGTIGHTAEGGQQINGEDSGLTDPGDAERFVAETHVDCLATSFGTAHGLYKAEPNLDFERLEKIAKQTGVPLVMHGGTGVPEEQIKRGISLGITKINYSTILRKEFLDRMNTFMSEHPEELMLTNIFGDGNKAMKVSVKVMMEMCGSVGKL